MQITRHASPTPNEKKRAMLALEQAIGDAETALEGADLDGLQTAGRRLESALNSPVFVYWRFRYGTARATLVRRAEHLCSQLGEEIHARG